MGRRQKHGSVPSSNHRLDIRVEAEKGDPSGMLSQGTTSKRWKYGDKRVRTGEVRQGAGLYNSRSALCSVRITEEQRESGHHRYHASKCGV